MSVTCEQMDREPECQLSGKVLLEIINGMEIGRRGGGQELISSRLPEPPKPSLSASGVLRPARLRRV